MFHHGVGWTGAELSLSGSCFFCSFSHEVININLKNKPDWFFEKNPAGLVPVLETSKGQLICESPITCEYLDEAFPGKKLMPSDPYERACQRMLLEDFSKVLCEKSATAFLASLSQQNLQLCCCFHPLRQVLCLKCAEGIFGAFFCECVQTIMSLNCSQHLCARMDAGRHPS